MSCTKYARLTPFTKLIPLTLSVFNRQQSVAPAFAVKLDARNEHQRKIQRRPVFGRLTLDRLQATGETSMLVVGDLLPGGWTVIQDLNPATPIPGKSPGYFSMQFVVERNGGRAFMKVLNLEPLTGGSLSVDKLQEALNYYVFERDILTHCRDKKLSRVVQIVDSFEQQVPVSGTSLSLPAYCLVFEMASGDSRSLFDVSTRSDAAILCVLHNVAVGLDQLHRNGMTHQDVKPANVLTFSSGKHDAKLADLGRAVWLGRAIPHDAVACPGDVRYAPFEQIYGDSPSTWLRAYP